MTPMVFVFLFFKLSAMVLVRYWCALAKATTFFFVSSPISGLLFNDLDTVETETPNSVAISFNVILFLFISMGD